MNADESHLNASATFGQMAWLYLQSPMHRKWSIASMQRWLLPPLLHEQYAIYFDDQKKRPIGLVTWAWLSPEIEKAYIRAPNNLSPYDWQSGDRGWIIDFIAPFGDARDIVRQLRHGIFKNDIGRFLRVKEGSETLRIMYAHGYNALDKAIDRSGNPSVFSRSETEEKFGF